MWSIRNFRKLEFTSQSDDNASYIIGEKAKEATIMENASKELRR